jgi:hypothetical protein
LQLCSNPIDLSFSHTFNCGNFTCSRVKTRVRKKVS